jgi:hypothetical protein
MSVSIPLEKLSIEEKIQMMELLWDDLRSRAGIITSPPWHGKILAERRAAVERGDEQVEDWQTARWKIEEEIR